MAIELFNPVVAEEMETAIRERRAVRRFIPTKIPRDLIDRVIDAGRYAPSALNRQPWNFYVLTDPVMINDFSKAIARASLLDFARSGVNKWLNAAADLFHAMKFDGWKRLDDPVFHGAPVVVFITAPGGNEWASLDVGMCAQNIMLMAHVCGLATCPIGFARLVEQVKDYHRLHIPEEEHVVIALAIGYPGESPVMHERKTGNIFYLNEG